MSLNILIIGTPEKHHKLVDALESGLYEVTIRPFSEELSIREMRRYSAIVLCLEDNETQPIRQFVQNLKQQRHLKHMPLIAYFNRNAVDMVNTIADLPFDDLLCPQQDNEYSFIAPKITTIYRRLQVLKTMQTRSELLELDKDNSTDKKQDVLLLLNEENTLGVSSFPVYADHRMHYCTDIADLENRLKEYKNVIVIIDACLGVEAMKLASQLSNDVAQHYPVMVLVPPENTQVAMQCVEIRAHSFGFLPLVMPLFDFKIATMRRWMEEYNRYDSSVEQQLKLSVRDELTNLYNRRYLNRLLERMSEQAENQQQKFSICLIDVDHFKQFNDTYGHAVGDTILSQLADQLELQIRRHDHIGRWGGEEFLLIFSDVTESISLILADRMRKHIAKYDFAHPDLEQALKVTISVGVAHYRTGETPYQLIDRADQVLYKAKSSGRNVVVAAE